MFPGRPRIVAPGYARASQSRPVSGDRNRSLTTGGGKMGGAGEEGLEGPPRNDRGNAPSSSSLPTTPASCLKMLGRGLLNTWPLSERIDVAHQHLTAEHGQHPFTGVAHFLSITFPNTKNEKFPFILSQPCPFLTPSQISTYDVFHCIRLLCQKDFSRILNFFLDFLRLIW